ncbi:MAG: tetratricopeptide repeat protein [Treponema sp.]|nr:tetratricopeptide repeat protein [Treponema sp.]
MKNPLDSIVYITLPEDFSVPEDAFQIDVTIPLPVQKPASDDEFFDSSSLSWEMILAGILTIMAYEKDNTHLSYYRSLLLSVRPDIKKELTEAAVLKARNADYEIAEEIFSALRGLDPEDVGTLVNSALFYDERGSSYRKSGLTEDADACDDQAYIYYKQAMTSEVPVPDAFFNAGFFFLKQKDFTRAKNVLETYLSLVSSFDEEISEDERYKYNRAKEIIQDISSRNLEDEQFKAAYDFILMGEEEKGMEQIRLFLEKNPKVWNAWFMLGWALRRLERWEDAKSAFNQAVLCGGENTDTFNELAICFLELGEIEESKKLLVYALSIEPDNTKIMSNLGYVSMRSGDFAEARKFFLTVLEFDPDDVLAKQMLEKMENDLI